MANISDIRLSVDMTRAVGRSLVRAGVAAQLETNNLAANDQAPLTTCRACEGQAVMEVQHGNAAPKPHSFDDLKGHPYWGKDRADQTSNGEEADTRPSPDGRGPSAVTIGERLHSFLVSQRVTSGYPWTSLNTKTKEAYEVAADYFLDNVEYSGSRSLNAVAESQWDELAAARGTLERIGKALRDAGAPQNCDDATAIQRLADAHQRQVENADKGFDNILAALKESGAVIDYGNPLQAAKDLSSEFRYLTDMYRKLDETLRDIRDEIGEAVDVTDMETISGAKRLVEMYRQHKQNLDEVRREAMLNTMKQIQSYIKATMQHVQPTETQL